MLKRATNSNIRFMIIDTCEIIMNNHTCEIIMNNHTCEVIDFISGEKNQ